MKATDKADVDEADTIEADDTFRDAPSEAPETTRGPIWLPSLSSVAFKRLLSAASFVRAFAPRPLLAAGGGAGADGRPFPMVEAVLLIVGDVAAEPDKFLLETARDIEGDGIPEARRLAVFGDMLSEAVLLPERVRGDFGGTAGGRGDPSPLKGGRAEWPVLTMSGSER